MSTDPKQIERVSYEGTDVTLVKRGRRTSQIRDQYGFLHYVSNKKLLPLNDEAKRTFQGTEEIQDF